MNNNSEKAETLDDDGSQASLEDTDRLEDRVDPNDVLRPSAK